VGLHEGAEVGKVEGYGVAGAYRKPKPVISTIVEIAEDILFGDILLTMGVDKREKVKATRD